MIEVPVDYLSIQSAIDAAADGDTILVAAGFYAENIDFLGKAIAVLSIDGAAATTINGSEETLGPDFPDVVVFANSEGPDSVLQGFTIEYGSRNGIFCDGASPTILDNVIQNNLRDGVGLIDSSPAFEGNVVRNHSGFVSQELVAFGEYLLVIRNCEFSGHDSDFGAAAYFSQDSQDVSSVVLEDCTFVGNSVGIGCAGILGNLPIIMRDCTFAGNSTGLYGPGAAFFAVAGLPIGTAVVLERCVFSDNAGDYGGALALAEDLNALLTNCVFAENTAATRGGALFIDPSPGINSGEIVVDRCTLVGNSAPLGSVAAQGIGSFAADGAIEFRNC
ncbi:MAG: right-handed parallel beta-helix repeat-containing protein, partial [Planctomycetes bacterium]|nr:right-handed parallel beta-helix repeat-containing protein [Planctomycetota bacterium]